MIDSLFNTHTSVLFMYYNYSIINQRRWEGCRNMQTLKGTKGNLICVLFWWGLVCLLVFVWCLGFGLVFCCFQFLVFLKWFKIMWISLVWKSNQENCLYVTLCVGQLLPSSPHPHIPRPASSLIVLLCSTTVAFMSYHLTAADLLVEWWCVLSSLKWIQRSVFW